MINNNNNSNPGHTKYFSPFGGNTCPCGNDTGSPQHEICVYCAADLATSGDRIWDEFWTEWDQELFEEMEDGSQ